MKKLIAGTLSLMLVFAVSSCGSEEKVSETTQTVKRPVAKKVGIFKNLSAIEFKELLNSKPGTILDVRELDEVKSGIIEDAIVVGLYSENFNTTINSFEKNKPVYIYDESGSLSVIAAKTLLSNGFGEVYSLIGGVTSWGMEGFNLVNPNIVKGKF
jgi:rhodanese-related sulfurtransferase